MLNGSVFDQKTPQKLGVADVANIPPALFHIQMLQVDAIFAAGDNGILFGYHHFWFKKLQSEQMCGSFDPFFAVRQFFLWLLWDRLVGISSAIEGAGNLMILLLLRIFPLH